MSDEKSMIEDGMWVGSDGCTYTYGKAPKRRCVDCRKEFVWDGNDYKTRCKTCYVKVVRVCAACGVNNLKADALPYQKVCTPCWLVQKGKKYKTCPTCPPSRALHLRCLIDKDCCSECAVRCVAAPVPMEPVANEQE